MKTVLLASLLLAAPAFAAPIAPIKTCSTRITDPEGKNSAATVIEITEENGALKAKTTQTINGQSRSFEEVAEITDYTIRPGLTTDANPDELNIGEALIVQAMTLTAMPELKGTANAGLDLKAVRSAKVYLLGKPTHMGLSAIVEAKDQDGKLLGSYLGGFLVSACK